LLEVVLIIYLAVIFSVNYFCNKSWCWS